MSEQNGGSLMASNPIRIFGESNQQSVAGSPGLQVMGRGRHDERGCRENRDLRLSLYGCVQDATTMYCHLAFHLAR